MTMKSRSAARASLVFVVAMAPFEAQAYCRGRVCHESVSTQCGDLGVRVVVQPGARWKDWHQGAYYQNIMMGVVRLDDTIPLDESGHPAERVLAITCECLLARRDDVRRILPNGGEHGLVFDMIDANFSETHADVWTNISYDWMEGNHVVGVGYFPATVKEQRHDGRRPTYEEMLNVWRTAICQTVDYALAHPDERTPEEIKKQERKERKGRKR